MVSKSRQLLHTLCNENTYSKEQKKKMFYFNIFNGSSRDERFSFSAWGQCVPVKASLACYMRSDSRGRRSDGGEQVKEGDMGVYVIAILSFFSSGISPYAVFHPTFFILGVYGKRRSFTVLRYCSFSLSRSKQVNIKKKNWKGIQDHLMTELFRWLYRSIWGLLTFFRNGWGWLMVHTCLR